MLLALSACAAAGVPAASPAASPTSVRPDDGRGRIDLPSVEREAIVRLGSTGAGAPADHEGHSHGVATLEMPLLTGDAAIFADQWLAAQRALPTFDTVEEAAALGYVRSSAWIAGIGTHWVKWSQTLLPFDPAAPAMLLFDERDDPAPLVGYSYALSSPDRPEGFAGGNDHWHQHRGLCIDDRGWVVREEADGPDQCPGTYLAGGDFWMLHAWVVPGRENRDGRFAPFNRALCPPALGTPDYARCPD